MAEVKRRRRTKRQLEAARRRRESSRAYHLKTTHHMTLQQYDAILESQDGTCFICRRARGKSRALSVDHDHAIARLICKHPENESCQGCWRGLLCATCNKMLGHARDELQFFARASAYLTYPPVLRWQGANSDHRISRVAED